MREYGEFKSGLKIIIDGDPYAIVENEMVKPGKGQAFNRVRVRNLKTGRTIERTWKSGDSVEAADVVDTDMQYLYSDGDFFHFMVPDTFEQVTASKEAVGEGAQWLKDGVVCVVTLWNGVPLQITPPAHMEYKIVETDPDFEIFDVPAELEFDPEQIEAELEFDPEQIEAELEMFDAAEDTEHGLPTSVEHARGFDRLVATYVADDEDDAEAESAP